MQKYLYILLSFISLGLFAQSKEAIALKDYIQKGIEFRKMKAANDSIKFANYDSSIYYLQKSVDGLKAYPDSITDLLEAQYNLGTAYWKKRNFKKVTTKPRLRKQLIDKALGIFVECTNYSQTNFSTQNYIQLADIYNYIGRIKGDAFNNYKEANEAFSKANEIYETKSLPDDKTLSYTCINLGRNYLRQGENQNAKVFLKKALDIYIKFNDRNYIGKCYQELGTVSRDLGNLEEAKEYYKKAIEVKTPRPDLRLKASLNLSSIYLFENDIEPAKKLAEEIIAFYETNEYDGDNVLCKAYEISGIVDRKRANFEQAFENLENAYDIAKKESVYGIHNRESAKILYNIGDAHFASGDNQSALEKFQSALYALIPNFDTRNVNKLPLYEDLYHEVWILECLKAKGEVFKDMYLNTDSLFFLERSYDHFKMCNEHLDLMRLNFTNESSKINMIENVYSIYDQAISIAYDMYSMSKDSKYLDDAFEFMEKSKAAVLLESIRTYEDSQNEGVPKELISEQNDIAQKINEWKLKEENSENDSIKSLATDTLYKLASQKEILRKKILNEYPNFKDLEYTSFVNSSRDVKSKLLNIKSALVEYFLTNDALYTFAISKEHSYFIKTPLDSTFDKNIEDVRKCLSSPNDSQESFELFVNNSNSLYDVVLHSVIDSIDVNINQLIIIPDYKLNYIPFEVLLTSLPEDLSEVNYKISNLDYLIKQYDVTYGYSASLLIEGSKGLELDELVDFNYSGFGPSFGAENTELCNGSELSTLDNTAAIEPIRALLSGVSYLDNESSKATFIKKSNSSLILHLHTHACLDDEFPMNSKIYFSDEPAYTYELYNLDLKADLAILSACNTGTGKLRRGEGLMSLSRAFMHSGCPSIVTSLWKASEDITRRIILNFNENLKRGQRKNRALKTAKLKFLNDPATSKIESHPFFWATFIHVGDTSEIVYKNQHFKQTIIIVLLLIGLLMILFLPYRIFYDRNETTA